MLGKGREGDNALQEERQRGGEGVEQKGPRESKSEEAIARLLTVHLQRKLTSEQPSDAGAKTAAEVRGRQREGRRPRGACLVDPTLSLGIFDLFLCSVLSFRWVVPANGEISLRIWFYRDSPGKFEQTFNFELLGTQRNYQLPCKGICSYPSICKDYRFGQNNPFAPWCTCCNWSRLPSCSKSY